MAENNNPNTFQMNIDNLKWEKKDVKSLDFSKFDFKILENSYDGDFYGEVYHETRMKEGNACIYLVYDNKKLVGLSYIKNYGRKYIKRGSTVVFPPEYRRKGIATKLIKESLEDFPSQYTILSVGSKMLSIVETIGFKRADTEEKIKEIVGEEEFKLFDFEHSEKKGEYFVFDRNSVRRQAKRKSVTLLYI